MQGHDACVANVRFTVMQLLKGKSHSKVSSQIKSWLTSQESRAYAQ